MRVVVVAMLVLSFWGLTRMHSEKKALRVVNARTKISAAAT